MYLPSLSHWENGNAFSGSLGRASWHARPEEGENGAEELQAEIWTWPPCYEQAEMERTARFPLTREGLDAMGAWLEEELPQVDLAARTGGGAG